VALKKLRRRKTMHRVDDLCIKNPDRLMTCASKAQIG